MRPVAAVLSNVCSRKHHLPIPATFTGDNLLEYLFVGPGDAPAPHGRDDAVGTTAVAPILNFHENPRSLPCTAAYGFRGCVGGGADPQQSGYGFFARLFFNGKNDVCTPDTWALTALLNPASREDSPCFRARSFSARKCLSAVSFCTMGNHTGINDNYIGFLPEGNDRKTELSQCRHQCACVREVGPATDRLYRYPPHESRFSPIASLITPPPITS